MILYKKEKLKMNRWIKKKASLLMVLISMLLCAPVVMAAGNEVSDNTSIGVAYRGHVENYGNMPKPEGTLVTGSEALGTRGQGLRVEGFFIELTGDVPEGAGIGYQVHVQNVGDIPQSDGEWGWVKNGEELGTTGSSLRLEELQIKIVKDGADLTEYQALVEQCEQLNEADFTTYSWNFLQTTLSENLMTTENAQEEVDQAVIDIQEAMNLLENLTTSIVYDQAATYGPASGTETIDQDMIVMADGVVLQNMTLTGNLIITEDVGDGDVTLNNITVLGETRIRGGGINSIHINGGQYSNIKIQKLANGTVRVVTTNEAGLEVVIAEDAIDDTVIIEGIFNSVVIDAPGARVITQGQTSVGQMTVTENADGAQVTVAAGTTVGQLNVKGDDTQIKGTGTVENADVDGEGAVFETRPETWTENEDLDIPPVMPDDSDGGTTGGGGGYAKPTLTITAPTLSLAKEYDGTADVIVSPGTLSGYATGEDVTVTATASYDNKTAGTGKTVTVTYTLGGADASKYNKPANYVSTSGEITKKQLTISGTNLTASKLYDRSTSADVTVGTLAGIVGSEDVGVTASATYDSMNAGTGKTITLTYTLTGADNDNYLAPVTETSAGTIVARELSVSGAVVTTSKEYDGNTTAVVTNNGTLNTSGVMSGDSVSLTTTNATYSSAAVENGKSIIVTYTLSDSNYAVVAEQYTTSGEITKKQLTIAEPTLTLVKEYDGNTTAAVTAGGLSGLVTGDTVTVLAAATYDSSTVGSGKTITVAYALEGTEADNYIKPVEKIYPNGEITAKQLTIADPTLALVKEYDGNATASVTAGGLTGVATGETVTVSAAATYDSSTVGTGKTITVAYTLGGADAGNYIKPADKTNTNGEISAKQLTISGTNLTTSKVYDRSTLATVSAGTLVGVVGSEDVSVSAAATYDSMNVETGKTITLTYTLSVADKDNYLAPVTETPTGTITAKLLTVSDVVVTTTKVYDGNTTAAVTNNGTLNTADVLSGDTVSITSVAANYSDSAIGTNKTITVAVTLNDSNYFVSNYPYSILGEITAPTQVLLGFGSQGTAGNGAITGLTSGMYVVECDGNWYFVDDGILYGTINYSVGRIDATINDSINTILPSTSITELTNGKTYNVYRVITGANLATSTIAKNTIIDISALTASHGISISQGPSTIILYANRLNTEVYQNETLIDGMFFGANGFYFESTNNTGSLVKLVSETTDRHVTINAYSIGTFSTTVSKW